MDGIRYVHQTQSVYNPGVCWCLIGRFVLNGLRLACQWPQVCSINQLCEPIKFWSYKLYAQNWALSLQGADIRILNDRKGISR